MKNKDSDNETQTAFASEIEKLSHRMNLSIMDSIVYYCESNKIEMEAVAPMVSKRLKDMLRREALNLRLIKEDSKSQKLPMV